MLESANVVKPVGVEPSPDSVLPLTAVSSSPVDLESVRKRLVDSSSTNATEFSIPGNKKIKVEKDLDENVDTTDPEVEIIEMDQFQLEETTRIQCNNASILNDDVQVVGTKHHVNLPHMRQHCTNCPYVVPSMKCLDKVWTNRGFCEACYCYVCDCKVSECCFWFQHCHASDKGVLGSYYKYQRDYMKNFVKNGMKNNPAPPVYVPVQRTQFLPTYPQAYGSCWYPQTPQTASFSTTRPTPYAMPYQTPYGWNSPMPPMWQGHPHGQSTVTPQGTFVAGTNSTTACAPPALSHATLQDGETYYV